MRFPRVIVALVLALSFAASHGVAIAQALPASKNPKFNASINPKFNASLNPSFNASINPKFNASLNPKLNASLNPKFNSSINPDFNASINPNYGRPSGLYLFNLAGDLVGLVARNGSGGFNVFSGSEWTSYAASNEAGGFNVFSTEGDWIGYLLDNSGGGLNLFTVKTGTGAARPPACPRLARAGAAAIRAARAPVR